MEQTKRGASDEDPAGRLIADTTPAPHDEAVASLEALHDGPLSVAPNGAQELESPYHATATGKGC